MAFESVRPEAITGNPFARIGSQWMLITAGSKAGGCNTMTASWGGLGVLWNKPVSFIFVRPQRYTREFLEREGGYSLCFFALDWHRQLGYLGTVSGRDEDKIARAGLTLTFVDGVPCFAQAELVLLCQKLYRSDLTPDGFTVPGLDAENYPQHDYHRLYVGEVTRALVKK